MNIISWNTRGDCIPKIDACRSSLFRGEKNNIIMIQESGSIENGYHTHTFGTSDRGHHFTGYFMQQKDVGNTRCTTGIFAENGLDKEPFFSYFDAATDLGKRPILYYQHTINPGTEQELSIILATVHLTACEGIALEELANIELSFSNHFYGKPWLIIGDFNCDPRNFISKTDNTNVLFPNKRTIRSGKILDFVIYSDLLKDKVSQPEVVEINDIYVSQESDHYPIRCVITEGEKLLKLIPTKRNLTAVRCAGINEAFVRIH